MTAPNIKMPASWGSKTILMGPYGSGKTHSLRTLLEPAVQEVLGGPLKVYAIFTEPSPMNVLQDILPKIHWIYRPPAIANWTTLQEIGKNLSSKTVAQLQGVSKGTPGAYNQFIDILTLCNDFVDSEGVHHGDISQLGPNSVFWLDSLTGINKMTMRLVTGERPTLSQPEWGLAMSYIQNFIDTITCSLPAHFVLCAHTEFTQDEVNSVGAIKILISTLGRKLAPVLPTTFSDVVLTQKIGTKFTWSTAHALADLRHTYLPLKEGMDPSFVPLLTEWKRRQQ